MIHFNEKQKDKLSNTFLDFSKIILAGFFAGEFFLKLSVALRIVIWIFFVVSLGLGICLSSGGDK